MGHTDKLRHSSKFWGTLSRLACIFGLSHILEFTGHIFFSSPFHELHQKGTSQLYDFLVWQSHNWDLVCLFLNRLFIYYWHVTQRLLLSLSKGRSAPIQYYSFPVNSMPHPDERLQAQWRATAGSSPHTPLNTNILKWHRTQLLPPPTLTANNSNHLTFLDPFHPLFFHWFFHKRRS